MLDFSLFELMIQGDKIYEIGNSSRTKPPLMCSYLHAYRIASGCHLSFGSHEHMDQDSAYGTGTIRDP